MDHKVNGNLSALKRSRTWGQNVTTYNRLVRDRIPEIIEAMGNAVVWKELDNEGFSRALLDTVMRASQQFSETESLETLSDLFDAVDAWLELKGLSMEEVARARAEKRKRCGTYDGRRYLEVVADAQNLDVLASREQRC
ncbi:nucleoside triphosphate pyrophosphohydrolase [Alicyclobacillus tolerans]|uniref:nucleoside triphosphate pyrophosphohydrolase n=1 Tax=Alicyclobacillus tolerans TaxID=90970 RepID=UPI001F3EA6DC|nr:nucleoside triphosphate pyrophosphohydrolase [Alicyclobacillus tolerans]MCF8563490.1 nucleoside triphosphate pyrophosphohydrolase [Alicyclobacillus tolerans]